MAKRVCLDCPTIIAAGSRCAACERRRDQSRGSRQERGYDAAHEAARRAWAPRVATGTVTCRRAPSGRCLERDPLIAAGAPWQLGHPDADCPAPLWPEHRRCNASTALPGRQGWGGTPDPPG